MKETIPNLYTIVPSDETKLVAPTFLAIRPEGNILFGNGAGALEYYEKMEKLGPIVGVYIGDRHHIKTNSAAAKYFNAPVCCSKEEAMVAKKKSVAIDNIVAFEHHDIFSDLEAIPTPGHTGGALSYLWRSGKNKVLFIGDTIVPVDGEWKVWVSKKNAPTMIKTMEMLGELEFNYIAIGSFAVTGDPIIRLSKKAKSEMVQSVISTLNTL